MKHTIPAVLMFFLAACGGGGDDSARSPETPTGPGYGPVTIEEPINGNGSYTTSAPSVEITGNAFVAPIDADCIAIQPVQLSLQWRNASTGQSGVGGIATRCLSSFLGTFPITRWGIIYGAIDLAMGANEITIRVSGGGREGTASITVNRVEDTRPPAIISRAPVPGAVEVPINRKLGVTFSEEMLFGSLTAERFIVEDPTGFVVDGFLDYDSSARHWSFDPRNDLAYSTEYTVTIGGGVEDRWGGNTMGEDVSWSFTTAPNPDVTPPSVTEISPAPNLTCVGPDAHVFAGFSEPLDASTVSDQSFSLAPAGGTAIDATVLYNGDSAELQPLLPLVPGTDYAATLSNDIADLAGNTLGTDYTWSFRTASTTDTGSWRATNAVGAPIARYRHTAVWTGTEMIVWGGRAFVSGAFASTDTGGRYDPATDTWRPVNTDGIPPKQDHSAVWTGTEMIAWGGNSDSGGRYDPGTDSWQPTNSVGAPSPRSHNVVAWTGTEMIVWGGMNPGGGALGSGARYNPSTDTWTPMSTESAPTPRLDAAHVWTGSELIVWGGIGSQFTDTEYQDGARYDPVTDTWTTMAATEMRGFGDAAAVWTGTEMVVWDGGRPTFIFSDGFPRTESTLRIYDPASDAWRASSSPCEPFINSTDLALHWTGERLFAWGDDEAGGFFYDPATDDWQPITTIGAPARRGETATVWTGERFILWGGDARLGLEDTGSVYTP